MIRSGLWIACLSMVAFVGCERHEDPAAIKSAIEALDRDFASAFNKMDIEGMVANYWHSPDLVVMFPDDSYLGYDALKANLQKTFAMVDVKEFEVTQHTVVVGRHMAYDYGTWNYTFQPKGGTEMNLSGRYLRVWEEKDGKWVIVADHASVPLPPPPPAEPLARNKKK